MMEKCRLLVYATCETLKNLSMEKKAIMVRKKGLEPSRQKVQTPEACASTNSATFALRVGDPDESRTHDHRLRKPILYPPELRDHT